MSGRLLHLSVFCFAYLPVWISYFYKLWSHQSYARFRLVLHSVGDTLIAPQYLYYTRIQSNHKGFKSGSQIPLHLVNHFFFCNGPTIFLFAQLRVKQTTLTILPILSTAIEHFENCWKKNPFPVFPIRTLGRNSSSTCPTQRIDLFPTRPAISTKVFHTFFLRTTFSFSEHTLHQLQKMQCMRG